MIYKTKEQCYSTIIHDNAHDQMLLFRTTDKLLQKSSDRCHPSANRDQELADAFANYFIAKIDGIHRGLLVRKSERDNPVVMNDATCVSSFSDFVMLTEEDVLKLITETASYAFSLDPLPAIIMRKCYKILVPVFRRIINLSLTSGPMPEDLKIAMVLPLLKKLNADFELFANFRPVPNLKFLSKLIEKSVFVQLNAYLIDNDLHEFFQSAYMVFHSTETASVKVTNDVMLSLNRTGHVFLILLDSLAAFDTVDDSLLLRMKKHFGISEVVLQWFESYLSNGAQFVTINGQNLLNEALLWGSPRARFWAPFCTSCTLHLWLTLLGVITLSIIYLGMIHRFIYFLRRLILQQ